MISLDELQAEEAVAVVRIGGKEMKVTYRPGLVTSAQESRLRRLSREDPEAAEVEMGEYMAKLLVDWDLVQGPDNEKVPITPETISNLPGKVVMAIQEGIREEMVPSGEASPPSPTG